MTHDIFPLDRKVSFKGLLKVFYSTVGILYLKKTKWRIERKKGELKRPEKEVSMLMLPNVPNSANYYSSIIGCELQWVGRRHETPGLKMSPTLALFVCVCLGFYCLLCEEQYRFKPLDISTLSGPHYFNDFVLMLKIQCRDAPLPVSGIGPILCTCQLR